MAAVRDQAGVTHQGRGNPEEFSTRRGGMPGLTACRKPFYWSAKGPESCSWPRAVPMSESQAPVDCMSCLVAEARQ